MIRERIKKLREEMKKNNIDFYIIPTADFHQSEYVGDFFKSREYITGFTGSQGTAIIGENKAHLWVDGRYFIQAEQQIKGTDIELMKIGEPNVPTIDEFLSNNLKENNIVAFDGRVVSYQEGNVYDVVAKTNKSKIVYEIDLIDKIWDNRPSISKEKAFFLDERYTGETTKSKLNRIRTLMKEKNATSHIITTIDDICWILNIRGNDVKYFPLVLSYAIIYADRMNIYIDKTKLDEKILENIRENKITIKEYNQIYEDVKSLDEKSVLIDKEKLNYCLYKNIPEKVEIINERNPEIEFKAIKNEKEIENIKIAEIKDSVAHIRFMKWLKENVDKEEITEMSATKKLDELREEMGNFIRPSFDAISAYGEHGAIVHYSSSKDTNSIIKRGNLYLSDTGAGFYEGSTDITRTFAIGEVSKEAKEHFTLVAIGNLRLANAKFMEGMSGSNLDILARQVFFERNINYNHGTGHGVGYLLSIHEAPANIMYRNAGGCLYPLKEGMIMTDEPGFYLAGKYGVRLENELLVRKGEKNTFGQFMYFETITFIPFDLDAIDITIMTETDKALLNEYHKNVFEKTQEYLNDEERDWLKIYTREI